MLLVCDLADTRNRVRDILQSEPLMAELTNQIIVLSVRNDSEYIRRQESLVSKLRRGFLSAELAAVS